MSDQHQNDGVVVASTVDYAFGIFEEDEGRPRALKDVSVVARLLARLLARFRETGRDTFGFVGDRAVGADVRRRPSSGDRAPPGGWSVSSAP